MSVQNTNWVPNMKYRLIILFFSVFSCLCANAKTIRVHEPERANAIYAVKLLKKALAYSGEKYQFEKVRGTDVTARAVQDVVDGTVDVFWVTTSSSLEEKIRPIRIPIYKGLLGHRVFIIHEDNQARFDKVRTFEDVKTVSIGQGRTWADSDILESNGFNVVRAVKYESLFHMVDGGRFDAFSRGVHEPWGELAQRRELDLTVEKGLVVEYKMPMYFFVNNDNIQLARAIESGLMKMIDDGSFDEFFFNEPMIKDSIEISDLANRRMFRLNNPNLSKETPIDNDKLWLDFSDL